jgi:hypothetical protein
MMAVCQISYKIVLVVMGDSQAIADFKAASRNRDHAISYRLEDSFSPDRIIKVKH